MHNSFILSLSVLLEIHEIIMKAIFLFKQDARKKNA